MTRPTLTIAVCLLGLSAGWTDAIAADCDPTAGTTGSVSTRDGTVELFDEASDSWAPVDRGGIALRPCMRLRTGPNDRANYLVADPGGDIRLMVSGNTEIEAPSQDHVIRLSRGAAYAVRPAVGDPSRGPAAVTFALPGLTARLADPAAAIELILFHDAAAKSDAVLLRNGALQIAAGDAGIDLAAGTVLWVVDGTAEPLRRLADEAWRGLARARSADDFAAFVRGSRDWPEVESAPTEPEPAAEAETAAPAATPAPPAPATPAVTAPPSQAADPRGAANRLAVAARQAYDRAATLTGEAKAAALQEALAGLRAIVDRLPTTDHAVALIGGDEVAGISIPRIEADLAAVAGAAPSTPAAPAAATAAAASGPAAARRLTLSVTLPSQEKSIDGQTYRFGISFAPNSELFRNFFGVGPNEGVMLHRVIAGTAAAAAGLRPGDLVLRAAGRPIAKSTDLLDFSRQTPSSIASDVEVLRIGDGPADLVSLLKEQAAAGSAEAYAALGRMAESQFDNGPVDHAEVVRLYRAGAEGGNGFAALRLANIHFNATGANRDYAEASRWYRRALELGQEGAAAHQLGYLYWNGLYWDGTRQVKDDREAVRLFRRAAEHKIADSYFYLGAAYHLGRGERRDYAEAIRWYRLAIDDGNSASAMGNLGNIYYAGLGVKKDHAEARKLYERAVAAGRDDFRNRLGNMYLAGEGGPKDRNKAQELFRAAAADGDTEAMVSLGLSLRRPGTNDNTAEAFQWFRKAADAGNGFASYEVAYSYGNGSGVRRDDNKAAEYLVLAVQQGNRFAIKQVKENANAWSVIVRRGVQRRLSELGHYNGAIDGKFGPGTARAIDALIAASK